MLVEVRSRQAESKNMAWPRPRQDAKYRQDGRHGRTDALYFPCHAGKWKKERWCLWLFFPDDDGCCGRSCLFCGSLSQLPISVSVDIVALSSSSHRCSPFIPHLQNPIPNASSLHFSIFLNCPQIYDLVLKVRHRVFTLLPTLRPFHPFFFFLFTDWGLARLLGPCPASVALDLWAVVGHSSQPTAVPANMIWLFWAKPTAISTASLGTRPNRLLHPPWQV